MDTPTLEIKFFNEQLHNIHLTGEVGEEMLKFLEERLSEIYAADNAVAMNNYAALNSIGIDASINLPTIFIQLTTYGGDVLASLGIYDMIKNLQKNYVVNIIANGYVMSAGILIMLAVDKKHRFSYGNSTFLLHTLASFQVGKIKQLEEETAEGKRLHNIIWDIYRKEAKIPEETLNDIYEKKLDMFIDAKRAKKWGLINEIINSN